MDTGERMSAKVEGWARQIRSRFRAYHALTVEDLAQEGRMGMYHAWRRWDPDKGGCRETFTSYRARGAMQDYARKVCSQAREMAGGDLDATVNCDLPGHGRRRSIESDETLLRFRRFLVRAWPKLDEQYREVIRDRFVRGLTLRECAGEYGTSTATVLRRERRALAELRRLFFETGGGRR